MGIPDCSSLLRNYVHKVQMIIKGAAASKFYLYCCSTKLNGEVMQETNPLIFHTMQATICSCSFATIFLKQTKLSKPQMQFYIYRKTRALNIKDSVCTLLYLAFNLDASKVDHV